MKNRFTISAFLLVLAVSFAGAVKIKAQDSRIPGEGGEVKLGAKAISGKLVFETEDKEFRWWFDSRLQLDGAMYFEDKNPLSNGTVTRRLTFALKSVLWRDWQAELDMDFNEGLPEARDMWIRYTFPKFNLALQVGNFKEPFGLERLNSSRLLTFLERSTVSNAFPLGRRMGATARYWNNLGQVTVGIFGHELGTRIDKGTRDEGYSTNLRVTAAPINSEGRTLHLGVAGSYKIPDAVADLSPNTIEIKARSETYVFDPKLLHTGDITDVNYYNRLGGELGFVYGPFYLQSEYMGAMVKRWYGKKDANFSGGYVTAAYMLTGETRDYFVDEGEFGPTQKPKSSWGAVELAARYSVLNLNDPDASIYGGQGNQLMLGLNYYPNINIKLQFNYSMVNNDDHATSKGKFKGNDDFSFFQMRIQASM
jgi:phosphate-selective porin OprO/OprP